MVPNRVVTRTLAALLTLSLIASWSGRAQAEEGDKLPPYSAILKDFKSRLKSKDPKVQQLAFDRLHRARDVAVFKEIVKGVKHVRGLVKGLAKQQTAAEAEYEKCIDDGEQLKQSLDISGRDKRAVEAYNKKARKIDRKRQKALTRLRSFETEFARLEGLLESASLAAAKVLEALDEEPMRAGVETLASSWLGEKALPENQLLFVDSVWASADPEVGKRLHRLFANASAPNATRIAALTALADREDARVQDVCLPLLTRPIDESALIKAAVLILQRLHRRASIEPLIEFLGREDLEDLRTTGHEALRSLTGETHGPYKVSWAPWWKEHQDKFQMPPQPVIKAGADSEGDGDAFYGIKSFSKRVLFIIDMSGSMDKASGKNKNRTKWDVAKEQLKGFIFGLDKDAVFNVILFNHSVVRWQAKVQEATEAKKRSFARWLDGRTPIGGTNIFDSLELGFAVAHNVTGRPIVDTVYFLTDGRPTAGKVQDPKMILKRIRKWNKTTQMRIHAVGIGDEHDKEFMRELANIGGGEYAVGY